jgi:predicted PurR-regulated permease PerM
LKSKIKEFLTVKNENLIKYFQKFDGILRVYIGWQIMASCIVATVGSIVYSIFSVPYGILLACLAGLLNPIPYFGSIFSLLIGGLVVLLVNDGNFVPNFLTIICTIAGIHFVNAYFLEPTIAGNKVGLHPVVMILSIFVFNSLFGIFGMLIAVPVTAVIMMFLQDIYSHYIHSNSAENSYKSEQIEE